MKNTIFKAILFIVSCYVCFSLNSFIYSIIVSLVSFVIVFLLDYFENIKLDSIFMTLICIVACIIPEFFYFVPVVMYQLFFSQKKLFLSAILFPTVLNFDNIQIEGYIFIILISFIECIISYQYRQDNLKIDLYKSQRDDLFENQQKLERKLFDVMEKQDYDIQIATLAERNRIAHEIHDNVGHLISSSILQIGAVMAISKDDVIKENLESIKSTLDTGMNSIRESIHNIYEDSLDLEKELHKITDDFKFCDISLNYNVNGAMPIKLRYSMIFIVKEALANVIKHSDATYVHIKVNEHPSLYQLVITDNGTKKLANLDKGMGIEGMKQRVNGFNGAFNIDDKNGVRIFISIPKTDIRSEHND